MYSLVYHYQQNQSEQIHGILQVGDIGAFPNIGKLDRATEKHAKQDVDELGFSQFIEPTVESRLLFENKNPPTSFFIRGNHEDFDYLAQFNQVDFFDPWRKLCFIPDGQSTTFMTESLQPIEIAAFGGIHPPTTERGRGKNARHQYRKNKHKAFTEAKYFDERLADKSFWGQPIDILLTHAGPNLPHFTEGSETLTALAKRIQPRAHLFGHHHVVLGPELGPGGSLLVGLDHLEFKKNGYLKTGSWGILSVEENKVEFTFCDSDRFEWILDVRKDNYRQILDHQ